MGGEHSDGPSRRAVLGAGALAALSGCAPAPPPAEPAPPAPEPTPAPDPEPIAPVRHGGKPHNVVFVITDDQRWDGAGFMGHPFLRTPNLDRLARQGAFCSAAFVTTALCCPSRATMLSGMYAHRHGVLDNQTELDPSIPSLPVLLQAAGYDTAYVGKWHMGKSSSEPRPGWGRWACFRGQGHYTYPGPPERDPADRGFNFDGELREVTGYVTDLVTDEAVRFIESRDGSEPFCLGIGHKACHAPFEPAERHRDAFADVPVPAPLPDTDAAYAGLPTWMRRMRSSIFGVERLYDGRWASFADWYRDYHRTLLAVDEGLGRVLAALEDKGLLEDTLVVFTSDNGFMLGEQGVLDKRCFYEASVRIPLVAHCPSLIEAGTRIDELVLNLDLAPTLLDAMGLEAPSTMQGASWLGLAAGRDVKWRKDFLYEYFFEKRFPHTPTVLGVRTADLKLVTYHGVWADDELYDLRSDPGETRNLIDDEAYLARRKRMMRRLRVNLERYGCRRTPEWDRDACAREG